MKMPALFDLTGRVAVVTGGNGGIGRGIALGLAEAGAAVAIFGRNDEKNQHVLSELKTIGVPSVAVKVDLTDRAGLEPALSRVKSELGGISILVNNAGNVSLSGGILHEKPEDWDNVIETQLNSYSAAKGAIVQLTTFFSDLARIQRIREMVGGR
jgi:2-dehydro-3-deoxy-D-gluconate 5-dehydrogenase